MNIRHFLLKIGVLDLNAKRMQRLMDEADDAMIQWAFVTGKWNIRQMAVNYFVENTKERGVSVLMQAMNDSTEMISQAAMLGLEQQTDSDEIHQEIAQKRQYWIDENEYREGRRNRAHLKSSVLTESKERGSKKTLDNVRNMLKKPMIGGKWF